MSNTTVSAIEAVQKSDRGLGKDGELLFHISDDMKRFKELTMGHPVIMGRKTWESIPEKFRPLSGRENIVITRNPEFEADGAVVVHSPDDALTHAKDTDKRQIFVIGGATIYEQLLPQTDRLYLTLVDADEPADTFFPPYEDNFTREIEREAHETDDGLHYEFITLERE